MVPLLLWSMMYTEITMLMVIKRGGDIRFITEITKENLHYCKELRKIVTEMRHLEGLDLEPLSILYRVLLDLRVLYTGQQFEEEQDRKNIRR
jgi:hypothetical protein